MYTGSMIDELIASVQRAEVSAGIEERETYQGHEYSFAIPAQNSSIGRSWWKGHKTASGIAGNVGIAGK